jgi:eukaryotic-like serine/threonine-protein kinase
MRVPSAMSEGDTPDDETLAMSWPAGSSPRTAPRARIANRYELLALLGAGGMGSVYRVRDIELEETVALKVLRRDQVGDPYVFERFRREVKLARRVTHPNVARIFDMGAHGEEKFLTMEFVDGEPLSTLLTRQGRLELRRAVEIGLAVCRGLEAAHAAGVVHRDLKPANVMLERGGRVVITDFGIARSVADGDALRTGGIVMGTPAYMAPEQVEGVRDVDARADIYSLGVTLFAMLTGEEPWRGDSALAIAVARLSGAPPDPRVRCADLPDSIAELIVRCMARHPRDRLASVSDVARALSPCTTAGAAALVRIPEPGPRGLPPVPTRSAAPGEKTIAVLPFRNAGAPEDEYLAEGLTEDLIDTLSMTPGLRVRPLSAVLPFAGRVSDPRELGRQLDVQVVIEGSVRRAANGAQIRARLLSVTDGFQLWAQRFDRSAGDLLVVSDEAAAAIADALTVHVSAPPREAPTDARAIDLYLRARAEYRRYWRGAVERSVDLFRQAAERAPHDATILAGYARACARSSYFSTDERTSLGDLARTLAERAVQVAPEKGDPWIALGTVQFGAGDAVAAAHAVREALSRAPLAAEAHELLANILAEVARPELALERFRTAQGLDPGLRVRFPRARCLALLGDFDRAFELLDAEADDDEFRQSSLALSARLMLWRGSLSPRPRFEEGEPLPVSEPVMYAQLVHDLLQTGSLPDAHRDYITTQFTAAGQAPHFVITKHQYACEIFAYRGERAAALTHLELAVASGLIDETWLERCPVLAPLRDAPAFATARVVVRERTQQVRAALGVD